MHPMPVQDENPNCLSRNSQTVNTVSVQYLKEQVQNNVSTPEYLNNVSTSQRLNA